MVKIVYILGAGFSAPFNIPITSEFLDRAKDIYERYPKYKHFKEIIDIVQKYFVSKKWYKIDLDNIEDLLSMLEMKRILENSEDNSKIIKFIVDVVNAYSERFSKVKKGEVIAYPWERWDQDLFGYDNISKNNILALLSAVFNIKYYIDEEPNKNEISEILTYNVKSVVDDSKPLICNFITLNYDMIMENALLHLNSFTDLNLKFEEKCENELEYENVYLAKLHGSINTDIIPPTWNKYFIKNIRNSWSLAYKLLSDANKIIIIGYSLPETDTYVRYLLGLAAVNSFNLKNIQIICADKSGEVFNRYKKFMNFKGGKIKFYNDFTENYLAFMYKDRMYTAFKDSIKSEMKFSIGIGDSNFNESIQPINISKKS